MRRVNRLINHSCGIGIRTIYSAIVVSPSIRSLTSTIITWYLLTHQPVTVHCPTWLVVNISYEMPEVMTEESEMKTQTQAFQKCLAQHLRFTRKGFHQLDRHRVGDLTPSLNAPKRTTKQRDYKPSTCSSTCRAGSCWEPFTPLPVWGL